MSTTLSGSVKDLSTAAVTSNTVLRFILRGLNGNIPRVNGTALVAQNPTPYPNLYYFDFTPDSSGNFSGTLYSTRDAAGTGNGDIEAGGSPTAVWYGMVLIVSGQAGPELPVHAKNGATLDPSNVTAISTTPVVTAPTGDTTYLRLDGGNNPMTGQLAVKNGSVSSPGLTFASSLTTGFWRQAADVIGVSIAGALKWLVNSVGPLFGSGQAIGFSSNSDPSLAAGDIWFNRQAANKAGLGTTASGKDATLLLGKLAAGGTEASGSTAGDITASRSGGTPTTQGVYYLGTDGNGQLFRSGDTLSLAGTTKTHTFPNNTGTIAELNLAQAFTASQTIGQTTIDGTTGNVSTYRNVATVGNGVSASYAQSDQTAQSASIGSSNLITGGGSTGGHYTLSGSIECSTSDASGATVLLTVGWTTEGVARTASTATVGFNSTANFTTINFPLNADASTNITWSTTVAGVPTTGRYAVHIWAKKE